MHVTFSMQDFARDAVIMSTPERQKRIAEFESLLNFQLKTELQKVQDERDQLYERISHCMELRNNMTMLQDQKKASLKTMVNLGCDFYVQAKMCAPRPRTAPTTPRHATPRHATPRHGIRTDGPSGARAAADPTRRGCTSASGWASTRR